MHLARLAPLAALAMVLSGCFGAPASDPGGDQTAAVELEPIGLTDCSMLIGFFPLEMELAAARMPPGFTPAPFPDLPGFARAGAWAWTCNAVNGTTGGWADAWAAILVTPPDAWDAEDIAFHAVLLQGANDRADMVDRYAAWNVTTTKGAVSLDTGASPVRFSAAAQLPSGPLALDLASTSATSGNGGVVRAFAVDDLSVTGAFEYHWTPYELFAGQVVLSQGATAYGASGPLGGMGGFETGAAYDFVLRPITLPPLP